MSRDQISCQGTLFLDCINWQLKKRKFSSERGTIPFPVFKKLILFGISAKKWLHRTICIELKAKRNGLLAKLKSKNAISVVNMQIARFSFEITW